MSMRRPVLQLRDVALAALSLLAAAAAPQVLAGAVSDGSWGRTPQTFSGQFTLPESLGRRAGNNLFHSFAGFSIASGESATFTTSTRTLANVIARVSGSEATLLDGQLRLNAASGSAPNFYLINPNGVTFGPGARINVPAAFHVSTAQELRFADGSRFAAGQGPDSSLTIAAPAAFGFLGGAAAAPITLSANARVSTFVDGRDIDLTAGSIAMNNAAMHNETGTLRLVAAGTEASAVPVDLRQAPATAGLGGMVTLVASDLSTAEGQLQIHAATLDLSAGASIGAVTSLFAPGSVDISVRDGLRLRNAFIFSHMASEGAPAGAPLRIRSGGSIDIGGSSGGLQTTTETGSAAGDIQVSTQTLNMSGQTNIASFTIAPGRAGNVAVDVSGQLRIVDNSGIYSQAVASSLTKDISTVGAGGEVWVNAGALTLDGTNSGFNPPSIGSDSNFVASPAGNVSVTVAGPLVLRNGGNITSSATAHPGYAPFITQRAGAVQVKAQTILIESDADSEVGAGIFSDSLGSQGPNSLAWGPGGPAGRVDVEAREIRLIGGPAGISADTSGPGAGGTVSVKADRLLLDGRDLGVPAISSTTLGQGPGGVVTVQVADSLVLRRGGLIQALAGGSGRGGSVSIEARTITAEGSGPGGLTTGVLGTSVGAGAAGDLNVRATERITLLQGAVISANANDQGPSGAIRVETRDLFIDGQGDPRTGIRSRATVDSSGQVGQITVLAAGQVLLQDAPEALTIKNESVQPNLPALTTQSILLRAGELRLDGAGLVASSSGAAPGNAIDVQVSGAMAMAKGARILTSAHDGNGGPIRIAAGRYLQLRDAQVESSVLGPLNGNGGNIRIDTPVLVLDNGSLQANTTALRASGGDVIIGVRALVPSGSVLRLGGTEPIPFEPGRPGVNVIQAAAPEGLSGNVDVAVPALDLAGTLRALDTQLLDVGIVGNDFCGIGTGSSLVRSGRGGLLPTIADVARPGR
jgi:filamentous hemagglutinin family protein